MAITLTNFKDNVKLIPLAQVRFFYLILNQGSWVVDTSKTIVLRNLEQEASLRFNTITRRDDAGWQRLLGYNYEIVFYIPYNLFFENGLIEAFNEMRNYRINLEILLGSNLVINSNGLQYIHLYSILPNIEIEMVEFRPRAIIKVNGFVKSLQYLFTNYAMYT